jgi:hypothetical protein
MEFFLGCYRNTIRAAQTVREQRSWRLARSAEQSDGATTASARARLEARERRRATLRDYSPPCAAPGRLHDGGEATVKGINEDGATKVSGGGDAGHGAC